MNQHTNFMRLFLIAGFIFITAQLNAQSLEKLKQEAAAIYDREAWDELMVKATDIMVKYPYSGYGYYYASWASLNNARFEEANKFFKEADEWAEADLIEQLIMLQNAVALANDPENKDYRAFLQGDKYRGTYLVSTFYDNPGDIDLGLAAVEKLIDEKNYLIAYDLLDHDAFKNLPDVSRLKERLKQQKEVKEHISYFENLTRGDEAMKAKNYTQANNYYTAAEKIYKNSYSENKVKDAKAWMAFEKASKEHTIESYESVVSSYSHHGEVTSACYRVLIPSYLSFLKKYSAERNLDKSITYYNKYARQVTSEQLQEAKPLMASVYYYWVNRYLKDKTQYAWKRAIVFYDTAEKLEKPHASIAADVKKLKRKWKKKYGNLPTKL